ncbi:TVP38/TMEM64 family protein [Pseudanabaena sp. UWO310]|nr:TVP38/TMEM64 family protein [Pseudanabaena sp. UWO310]
MKRNLLPKFFRLCQRNFKILLFLGIMLLFFITPLRGLLDRQILSSYLQSLGIWTIPLFISTYVLVAILGLPITMHTLAGGVLFGFGWGTVWSTLAATLGALGAFYFTRYIFHDWAIATFGNHKLLRKLNQAVTNKPFNLVLSLRFAPIAPFNIINFLLALTPINSRIYTFATFIGVIPGTVAYTWLGVSGKSAIQDNELFQFTLASCFLVLLSLLPFGLQYWQRSRKLP